MRNIVVSRSHISYSISTYVDYSFMHNMLGWGVARDGGITCTEIHVQVTSNNRRWGESFAKNMVSLGNNNQF